MKKEIISIDKLSASSNALIQTLQNESEMECVVVGSAFLDAEIGSLLHARLRSSKVTKKLLSGVLSTFSARVDIAYCMELINKGVYEDLCKIAEIRNEFAHSHLALSFNDPKILSLCNELQVWVVFTDSPEEMEQMAARRKFMITTAYLSEKILEAASSNQ